MFPASIQMRIRRTWIQCQSLQMLRTDSIWRHNKGAIINAQLSDHDHDHVQAMTAVKEFGWKWIAVNPLETIAVGMT